MSSERRRNIVITIPQGWMSVLIGSALAAVLPWLLVQTLVMLAYFGQISNVWLVGTTWGDSAAVATALWAAGYFAPVNFGAVAITLKPLGASLLYILILWGALRAWEPRNLRAAWYSLLAYPVAVWALSFAGGHSVEHGKVALGALLIALLACVAFQFTRKPKRDREARQARAAQLAAVESAGVSLETGNLDVHAEAAAATQRRVSVPWKKAGGATDGAAGSAAVEASPAAASNKNDTQDSGTQKSGSAGNTQSIRPGRFAKQKAKWQERSEERRQLAAEHDQGFIPRLRNWDNAVRVDARLQRSGIDRRAHRVALPFAQVAFPGWVFDGLAAAGRVLGFIAVATLATLIVWTNGASKQIADIHQILGTTSWENFLFFFAQLGFIVTLQTWALAWWTGGEFATATNSLHSLGIAQHGPVPAIPALVAIPRTAPGYGLIAITVLVALVIGWWLYTGYARVSFAQHLGVAAVLGGVVTGVVSLCAFAGAGAIGAGRMSFLGVEPGQTIGMFAASFLLPLLFSFVVLHPQVRGLVTGRHHLELPERNRVGTPAADADDTQTQWLELPKAAGNEVASTGEVGAAEVGTGEASTGESDSAVAAAIPEGVAEVGADSGESESRK